MTTIAKTSPLYFSMQAIWGVEFLRTLSSFKKGIENSSSYGYILQETSHWEVSRHSRTVDVK